LNIISSKDNNLIKQTKKLKEKKYRKQSNSFLVEGFRFVFEAIKSDFKVINVFVNETSIDKLENDYKCIKDSIDDNNLYKVSDNVFKLLTSTENPQGIIAVVENKKHLPENQNGFYILADKVQDPGNMGTIIRTAHASGALGVITTDGTVDIYNEKTLRSTMGSIFYIPVIEDSKFEFLNMLRENQFKLLVSSLKDSNNIYDIDFKDKKLVVVVGNEGNGVSKEVYDMADERSKIPMPGNAESLNVAVASSVIAFEIVRQNLKKH